MKNHDPGSGLQTRNSGLKGLHTYAQPFLTSNGTWPTSLLVTHTQRKPPPHGPGYLVTHTQRKPPPHGPGYLVTHTQRKPPPHGPGYLVTHTQRKPPPHGPGYLVNPVVPSPQAHPLQTLATNGYGHKRKAVTIGSASALRPPPAIEGRWRRRRRSGVGRGESPGWLRVDGGGGVGVG